MSDKKKLKTFNIKKDKKAQAKKRKLESFLNLVRQDEEKSIPIKRKSGGTFQENYKALKDELKKYQKIKSDSVDPSISLKVDGRCALINFLSNGKISKSTLPLFLEDIHNFLLVSVLGRLAPFPIRWAKLECASNISKTVLIEIEGLSKQNAIELHTEFNKKSDIFPFVVEVVSENMPFAIDLSSMHLANSLNQRKDDYSSMFPMDQKSSDEAPKPTTEYKVSKLHLLLSPIQLAMEHYPLPQSVFEQSKSDGYCFSKESYSEVHENSPMFAVDCEMCRTVSGRQEVTRIAIVNENLETIYHTLVKPKEEIVDYITRFSGITEKMLVDVTTTLEDVHRDIQKLLPSDAILCGQSLNCDLHSLKMIHPYIIDTSIIFNEFGVRQKKTSLKKLVHIHLKEKIQDGKRGHNPIEDSIATMKLVQLKLKNSIEYGDAVLSSNKNDTEINEDEKDSDQVKNISDDAVNEKIEQGFIKLNPDTVIEKIKQSFIKLNPEDKSNGFFYRLSRFSKKTCLIGCEDSLSNYCEEIITNDVTKIIKSNPKKIMAATVDNIENYDLILSHLFFDGENCTITELKNEIVQAYDAFPKRTLLTILLSGINKQSKEKFKHSFFMPTLKK